MQRRDSKVEKARISISKGKRNLDCSDRGIERNELLEDSSVLSQLM